MLLPFLGFPFLVLLGIAMIHASRGVKRKAFGKEAACATCWYDVSTLDLDVCPECGSSLSGRGTVRRGDRRRLRPVMLLVVGVALVALPIGMFSATLANHVGRNVWGSITIANQSREVRLQKRSPDPARSWVVTIGVDETSREDSSGTEIDPEPVNVEFWNRDTSSDTIRIEVDPRTLICRGDVDDRTFDEALCDELLREWRPDLPPDSSEVASIVDGITSATLGTVELKSWSDHDAALAFDVIGSSSSSSSSSRPDPRIGHLVRATVIAGWIAGVALLIILLFARRRSIRRDASR